MYIVYKNKKYPCRFAANAVTLCYKGLPVDFPGTAEDVISLFADDGFPMRSDDPAGFARQSFEDGTLTLTNSPAPTAPDEKEHVSAMDILDTLLGGGI